MLTTPSQDKHSHFVEPAESVSAQTIAARCRADLTKLVRAVQGSGAAARAAAHSKALALHFGQRSLTAPPAWSGVCDDCSPYELSLALSRGAADVRLLVEAQSEPPSVGGYWAAGGRLQTELVRLFGGDEQAFDAVADAFEPIDPSATFARYHAIEWRADGRTLTKVYLNPAASGPDHVRAAIGQAAERLGVEKAWSALATTLGDSSRPVLLSLDLARESRFKVYVRRWQVDPAQLNDEFNAVSGTASDAILRLAAIVAGPRPTFSARPIFVVHHLTPDQVTPGKMVVDVPLFPYVETDLAARDCILRLLEEFGVPSSPYERALHALGPADLARSVGFHTYVSLQLDGAGHRITTYFSPLLYAKRYGFAALTAKPGFWSSPV